jgi:hypothetical protein
VRQRIFLATAAILAACCAAHGQVKRLNGTYIAANDPGKKFSVDGVPWNDGDSITVVIGNREISAFRPASTSSFIYSNAGCTVSFTPRMSNGKQAMRVESRGACTGNNAALAGISAAFIRPRDPWR